jgi:hypothetical protein
METKEQHCQRGGTNPLDESEARDPEEFIMGEYRTKKELFDYLNQGSRVTFFEDEHADGQLYIRVNFEETE